LQNGAKKNIEIDWEANKAVAIVVPKELIREAPADSVEQLVHINLKQGTNRIAILGSYSLTPEALVFRPLIAFTRGLNYEITFRDKLLGEVQIPAPDAATLPTVLNVYPTRDTLPQNLLKFYIEFSRPMVAGEALQHISLVKNRRDTVPAVFLDLQPELWNNEGTILTLWLDPGRIKRDLQPNKAMGPPLEPATDYQLVVHTGWKNTEGSSLQKDFQKNFITGPRDDQSPDPVQWVFHEPKAASSGSLQVELHESLDYVLLKKAVRIVDGNGKEVEGNLDIGKNETVISFTPSIPWKAGAYFFEVESRLEDNAGNNLNRPFDNDLLKARQSAEVDKIKKKFQVQ
jgi:hypothetical protein